MTDGSQLLRTLTSTDLWLHNEPSGTSINWALSNGALSRLAREVSNTSVTAETGCGHSTLLFGALAREHHCFTLDSREVHRIREAANQLDIDLSSVTFYLGDSASTLPAVSLPQLSLALVDGAHAYPYPVLDWFYLTKFLGANSLLVVDDVWMPTVKSLTTFLEAEPMWTAVGGDGQTRWYRRCAVELEESTYPDRWNLQGLNRRPARRDRLLQHYSRLPRSHKVLRHPVLTASVVRRLARDRFEPLRRRF